MGWVLLGALLGFVLGSLAIRLRKSRVPHLTVCEYWVYIPRPELPSEDAAMRRMLADNPYSTPNGPCIGSREGALFTDIRLSVGLVLRDKNPHVFRPDLLGEATEPEPESLDALAQSRAFVKVRFLSEEPVPDLRHLRFVPHLACSYLDLAEGLAVYDPLLERLWTADGFRRELAADPSCERPELHRRVVWAPLGGGGYARTLGIRKCGAPEVQTLEAPTDQRVLLLELMEACADRLWEERRLPTSMALSIERYGDRFDFLFRPGKGVAVDAAIRRRHER